MTSRQPTATAFALPPDKRPGKGYFARAVGAFVPKLASAAFERYGFHSAEIMTSWETIVGAELARLTRPEAIKWPRGARTRSDPADENARASGATLIVACDPSFALEISYRGQDIVDRINRYFGYRAIAHFKLLQVPGTAVAAAPASPPVATSARPASAGGDLAVALDALGRSITHSAKAR